MAEKRKGKKRKEELTPDEPEKPSKEEYAVAKWLRKNVPTKKTKFLNHNVEYFTAIKAVDALMGSHWAAPRDGEDPVFPSRVDVVEFMDMMLRHKFFHRAKKVPVSEQELKAKLKKKDKDRKKVDVGGDRAEDAESSHAEGDKVSGTLEEKEKRKRKIRLEMHLEQIFVDGLDAYVWIYDPIPVYYWFFGTLLVLGAIAICLFPLWPPSVRKGVYYLSIAAAGFLIFIIALALVRLMVFCFLWLITFGKHHLWLFPNLTEDVGFLASFWPLYQYEYKGGEPSKKSRKKKDKDSDNEEEKQEVNGSREDENKTEGERPTETSDGAGDNIDKEPDNSESESESSQKSQTGKDFEMVEREEVES
ncbi:translocation protein SEC62 [Anabrus simplex]|uniref:translocation protein SEC62 n=1 Tax=Anabrus simplex TaxID=316456 RepID=UPI0034DCE368